MVHLSARCTPSAFAPVLPGGEVLSVQASMVEDVNTFIPADMRWTSPAAPVEKLSFCNVTVTYTHPGQHDLINVEAWLPTAQEGQENGGWNGIMYAAGGGGWVAGRDINLSLPSMTAAASEGYAAITTDGGLNREREQNKDVQADSWTLLRPGNNVDLYALQNFASVSLNDMAILGKSLIGDFYERGPPRYSYFNGCSGGGRQGLMLAQRYPDAFDGISANAPAVYWAQMAPALFFPYQVMLEMGGSFPDSCEIDAITHAARLECDGLDGLVDGIVGDPIACLEKFKPGSQVGRDISCPFDFSASPPSPASSRDKVSSSLYSTVVSDEAARVVDAIWKGSIQNPNHDPKIGWFGFTPGADLTGNHPGTWPQPAVVNTACTYQDQDLAKERNCTGTPNGLTMPWMRDIANAGRDVSNLSATSFDELTRSAFQRYRSIINTDDADLSAFKARGGKMVTFHGLDDQLLTPFAMERYYQEALSLDPDLHSFYRYFEVPGMGHCWGGPEGVGVPESLFGQLRAWVENGTAPESSVVSVTRNLDGTPHAPLKEGAEEEKKNKKKGERIICPYPARPRWVGMRKEGCDDYMDAKCWTCDDDHIDNEEGLGVIKQRKSLLSMLGLGSGHLVEEGKDEL